MSNFYFYMIKFFKLIITIILLYASTSFVTAAEYGNWSLRYYVDEFGDDTDSKYIMVDTEGLFSNSATTNSRLYVQMLISADEPLATYFKLYEYGSSPVTSYDSYGDPYRCSMKNSENEKYKFTALLGGAFSQTTLGTRNEEKLIEWISLEEKIKFVCIEDGVVSSKYNFELNFEGYGDAMQALLQ